MLLVDLSEDPNSPFVTRLQHRINKNSRYESLDCQQCYSELWKREYVQIMHLRKWLTMARWIVDIMIGLWTAIIAGSILITINYVLEMRAKYILSDDKTDTRRMVIVWMTSSIAFASAGGLLAIYEPLIVGNGLVHVMCYLNGVSLSKAFTMKVMVMKIFGLLFAELGGLLGNEEGPMIHIGACVGAIVWNSRLVPWWRNSKVYKFFYNDVEKRNFVLVGATSGIAAGFGAPIGGVILGLEATAGSWNQDVVWNTLVASAMCSFIIDIVLYNGLNIKSAIGHFALAELKQLFYEVQELPIFIAMAVVGGVVGALFTELNTRLYYARQKYFNTWWKKLMDIIIITAIINIAHWAFVRYLIYCRPRPDKHFFTYPVQVHCKSNEYNVMGSFALLQLGQVIKWLFTAKSGEIPEDYLAIYGTFHFCACVISASLNVALGMFYALILTGGTFGRLLGEVMTQHFNYPVTTPGKYAVIGGAAYFGGVIRSPLAFAVMLVEGYEIGTPYIVPMMFTLLTASFVADLFNESFIEKKQKVASYLPADPADRIIKMKAVDIMSSPVICLKLYETARYVKDVIQDCDHNGFPVVEDVRGDNRSNGRIVGIILRSQLIVILVMGYFVERRTFWENTVTYNSFREFYKKYPDANLVEMDFKTKKYTIDFTIFMNPSPFCVPYDQPVRTVFHIFRGLSLRHMVVVNEVNQVIGIVTRKDFLAN